ncbi:hypothetical protein CDV55_102659 [Aspergillus turcosus]|nr:hypothetical protein CDV55_102659 [Aspergillus turcosus]
MTPEDISVGGYSHLIFAFLYIDPDTYELTPMESNQTDLYARFTALKQYGVETWISIGGWAMNDPGPYSNVFSDLAASTTAQQAFLNSLISFLGEYGFDGVDFDWEYPGAPDRFGTDADYANFVSFLENVRSTLGSYYGLSITLPSSYWYLQYFDIVNIAKTIDWFNFMSYDIYGTWDATIASIGDVVYASTNLTMIDSGLQLLWHNNIPPSQVNLGLGYYGRSYTLEDPSCVEPGCPFSAGGNPGPCTQTEGMLSYDEIMDIIDDPSRNPTVWLDSTAAVKIAVYDDNQWVAYDDAETLQMKLAFANSECMGGVFAWAVDEDLTGDLSESISNSTDLFPAGGSGEVYVSPDIWSSDSPEISCQAPCTFILPPFPLPASTTISWPPLTTSVLVSTNGGVSTMTTTISVPEFPVSAVPFWPVTIASNQTIGVLNPVQSIAPPSLVLTFPGSVAPFPPASVNYTVVAESQLSGETATPAPTGTITSPATTTTSSTSTTSAVVTPSPIAANMASGCTGFYLVQSGDSCWSIETAYNIAASDFEAWNPAVGTDCSSGVWLNYYYCISHGKPTSTSSGGEGQPTSTGTTVIPVFYTTSHPVTIQPQATYTTALPQVTVIVMVAANWTVPYSAATASVDFSVVMEAVVSGGVVEAAVWSIAGPAVVPVPASLKVAEAAVELDGDRRYLHGVCEEFLNIGNGFFVYYYYITPSTTTTTISTTGTYSTITNSFMFISQPTQAASVLDSISASIVSQRSVWDATRWAGFTITITPTSTTTSTQPTGTGFSIVDYTLPYTNYEYVWLAINYNGLSAPIIINGSVSLGMNLTNTNSQTTFCDQTSTFNQESSGNVLGSSDNGSEYDCTTVLNPTTTIIAQETVIVPQWNCLTNICT